MWRITTYQTDFYFAVFDIFMAIAVCCNHPVNQSINQFISSNTVNKTEKKQTQ